MFISESRNPASYWHQQYDIGSGETVGGNEVRLNYHRKLVKPAYVDWTANIKTALGWLTGDAIAIIGGGFGFLCEELQAAHSFTNVVNCDDSRWIQAACDLPEEEDIHAAIACVQGNAFTGEGLTISGILADGGPRTRVGVLDENLLTLASRNAVKQELGGGQVDYVFTDYMLPYITDAEATAFSEAANEIEGVTVQHIVPTDASGFPNTNSPADWKALLPNDTILTDGFVIQT